MSSSGVLFTRNGRRPSVASRRGCNLTPNNTCRFSRCVICVVGRRSFTNPHPEARGLDATAGVTLSGGNGPSVARVAGPRTIIAGATGRLGSCLGGVVTGNSAHPMFVTSRRPLCDRHFGSCGYCTCLITSILGRTNGGLSVVCFFNRARRSISRVNNNLSCITGNTALGITGGASIGASLSGCALASTSCGLCALGFACVGFNRLTHCDKAGKGVLSSAIISVAPARLVLAHCHTGGACAGSTRGMLTARAVAHVGPGGRAAIVSKGNRAGALARSRICGVPGSAVCGGKVVTTASNGIGVGGLALDKVVGFSAGNGMAISGNRAIGVSDNASGAFLLGSALRDNAAVCSMGIVGGTGSGPSGSTAVSFRISPVFGNRALFHLSVSGMPSSTSLAIGCVGWKRGRGRGVQGAGS